MGYESILLDIEEEIAIITFNRPEFLNALSTGLLREFRDVLKELETNDDVKIVVLTGAGQKAFVAGADIREIREMHSIDAEAYSSLGHECLFLLEKMPKVVIAAVNGFALGGGTEIALACDFIFASENATFGQPEVILGVMPGFGGTQRLPKAVGIRRARELIYTAERIDAKSAMDIGLVNRVFPPEALLVETKQVAKKISANSFSAVAACKKAINNGFETDLARGCEFEQKSFALTFDHEDFKEGVAAFLERRSPNFKR
jgi:enoyl-CoA hydratase